MARDYRAERRAYYGYGPASSVTPLQRKPDPGLDLDPTSTDLDPTPTQT